MSADFTRIVDLAKEVEPPDDAILTYTIVNEDDVKAVIFGFGPRYGRIGVWLPRTR